MAQIDFILWLQSFRSPLLDAFFTVVNATAEDNFITALAVILYWCITPIVGLRFLLVLLFSGYLNTLLKDLFHTARPTAEQVLFLATPPDGSYAFPSGHTQNAAIMWSYLAGHHRKKPLVIAAAVMIPLVGLSRIYRGAHWPVDVLGGMAIGLALVWLALNLYRFWDRRSLSLPLWGQLERALAVRGYALLGAEAEHLPLGTPFRLHSGRDQRTPLDGGRLGQPCPSHQREQLRRGRLLPRHGLAGIALWVASEQPWGRGYAACDSGV